MKKQAVLLLLNDIHVSKENITDFKMNWHEAISICCQRGIKEMVLGGDLFMSRSSQNLDVLLAVHDGLLLAEENDIRITLANGNHDKIDPESFRGYCHVFDQHKNVTVADDFVLHADPKWDFNLYTMAYFPEEGTFIQKLKNLIESKLKPGKKNYLYVHEGINGALTHAAEKEVPATIFAGFDQVFAGHYHNRTVIPGTNVAYIGASRQHNFGEDEAKGYTLLYADGSTEFIQNEVNFRYRVFDVPGEKVDVYLLNELEALKENGLYRTKLRIHCLSTHVTQIDKDALFAAGAHKVEIIADDIQQTDVASTALFEKFTNRQLRAEFKLFCVQKGIEHEIAETGLFYLQKIDSPCGD